MKRIVCIALGCLLCYGTTAAQDKEQGEQLHKAEAAQLNKSAVEMENFHITPATTPDHIIGQGGPLVMDRQDAKTVQYTDVDAVNRAINAVAMTNVSNAMHGSKGKPWMRRTTLSFQFQQDWKPLYSVETVQPLGYYDDTSRQVWFTQQRLSRVADIGTTMNVGIGYRRISKDDHHLYGAHLFYDHRFLGHHGRLSAGLEYMSDESEFRFNW